MQIPLPASVFSLCLLLGLGANSIYQSWRLWKRAGSGGQPSTWTFLLYFSPNLLWLIALLWLSSILYSGLLQAGFFVFAGALVVSGIFEALSYESTPRQLPRRKKVFWVAQSSLALVGIAWCVHATSRPIFTQPFGIYAPLRGDWVVAEGGVTRWTNAHHGNPESQNYAIDFVFKPFGFWIDPTVYSPVYGRIFHAESHWRGAEGPAEGNHVVISTPDGVLVTLAHLAQDSIVVNVGDSIEPGDPIGRVGTTGSATRMHLHIHGERDGNAVPLVFLPEERWMIRGDKL